MLPVAFGINWCLGVISWLCYQLHQWEAGVLDKKLAVKCEVPAASCGQPVSWW